MKVGKNYRRKILIAIPVVWVLFLAVLRWTGAIGQPDARAAELRPAAPAAAPSTRPAWQTDWPGGPRRDLFLTRIDNFPRDVGTQQQPMRPGDSATGAKSSALPADQNHDAPASGTPAELGGIHLQSTMMNPVPRALVNGQIVGEGDFVGSFRMVRITLSQIVLEKQGVQYPIALK